MSNHITKNACNSCDKAENKMNQDLNRGIVAVMMGATITAVCFGVVFVTWAILTWCPRCGAIL